MIIGVIQTVWASPDGSPDASSGDVPFESADEAVRLIADRCAAATMPGRDGEPTMWNTELIRRPDGCHLHVGWCDHGWLLMGDGDGELVESDPSARRAPGVVVFDLGQWTELHQPYLVDGAGCRRLLQAWLAASGRDDNGTPR